MRRVPDIMPVCLQDKLRYRKSAVREQEQVITCQEMYLTATASFGSGLFFNRKLRRFQGEL